MSLPMIITKVDVGVSFTHVEAADSAFVPRHAAIDFPHAQADGWTEGMELIGLDDLVAALTAIPAKKG